MSEKLHRVNIQVSSRKQPLADGANLAREPTTGIFQHIVTNPVRNASALLFQNSPHVPNKTPLLPSEKATAQTSGRSRLRRGSEVPFPGKSTWIKRSDSQDVSTQSSPSNNHRGSQCDNLHLHRMRSASQDASTQTSPSNDFRVSKCDFMRLHQMSKIKDKEHRICKKNNILSVNEAQIVPEVKAQNLHPESRKATVTGPKVNVKLQQRRLKLKQRDDLYKNKRVPQTCSCNPTMQNAQLCTRQLPKENYLLTQTAQRHKLPLVGDCSPQETAQLPHVDDPPTQTTQPHTLSRQQKDDPPTQTEHLCTMPLPQGFAAQKSLKVFVTLLILVWIIYASMNLMEPVYRVLMNWMNPPQQSLVNKICNWLLHSFQYFN